MTTRCRLRQFMAVSLSLALSLLAACGPRSTPTPVPTAAVLGDVVNVVLARPSTDAAMTPATEGYGVVVGSTIATGDQSKVRINFDRRTLIRLSPQTIVTLEKFTAKDGVFITLQLVTGAILVSLAGGSLEVENPLGNVTVLGSYAMIEYARSPTNAGDSALIVKCLAGSCYVKNGMFNRPLGAMQQLVLADYGTTATQSDLPETAVADFLAESPESITLVATLTAAPSQPPSPTATSTWTPLPTIRPPPSATLIPASPTPSPTSTRPPARTTVPPATATSTPPPPTNTSAPPSPPPSGGGGDGPPPQPTPAPPTEPPTGIPPSDTAPPPSPVPPTETEAPPTSNPTRTLEPKETPPP
ncbi:MAG TPA: FecR domain-containing protein [Anaerolineales bacterium]|nr:FecR domain-containing protein [Anaerolineales bacterium]